MENYCQKFVKLVVGDPKEMAKQKLMEDYGNDIHEYLSRLSEINGISKNHLDNHKVTGVYRAKMVDWMVEVLSAFKCSD
jgi:cyclin B